MPADIFRLWKHLHLILWFASTSFGGRKWFNSITTHITSPLVTNFMTQLGQLLEKNECRKHFRSLGPLLDRGSSFGSSFGSMYQILKRKPATPSTHRSHQNAEEIISQLFGFRIVQFSSLLQSLTFGKGEGFAIVWGVVIVLAPLII